MKHLTSATILYQFTNHNLLVVKVVQQCNKINISETGRYWCGVLLSVLKVTMTPIQTNTHTYVLVSVANFSWSPNRAAVI